MKKITFVIAILFTLLLTLSSFSCSNIFDKDEITEQQETQKYAVHFGETTVDTSARTIYPNTNYTLANLTNLNLTVTKLNTTKSQYDSTSFTGTYSSYAEFSSAVIFLEAGTYTFYLTAAQEGMANLAGTTTGWVLTSTDQNPRVSIILTPSGQVTNAIDITVYFPKKGCTNKVNALLYSITATSSSYPGYTSSYKSEISFSLDDTTHPIQTGIDTYADYYYVHYTETPTNAPTGTYLLKLSFENYSNSISVTEGNWQEVIYVYDGCTSSTIQTVSSLNSVYKIQYVLPYYWVSCSSTYYKSGSIPSSLPTESDITYVNNSLFGYIKFIGWYQNYTTTFSNPVTSISEFPATTNYILYGKCVNVGLASVSLSNGSLNETFAGRTTSYTISGLSDDCTITPTRFDSNAKLYNGDTEITSVTLPKTDGASCTITVKNTVDGITYSQDYKFTYSLLATLSKINLSSGFATQNLTNSQSEQNNFTSNVTDYAVWGADENSEITITPTATDSVSKLYDSSNNERTTFTLSPKNGSTCSITVKNGNNSKTYTFTYHTGIPYDVLTTSDALANFPASTTPYEIKVLGTPDIYQLSTALNSNTNISVILDLSETTGVTTSNWPCWWGGATNVTKLILPGTIETLSSGCVSSWSSLQEVVVSEGTKALDIHAFAWLNKLKKVTLPDSITSIGEGAFDWDVCLGSDGSSFILPKNLSTFGSDAIRGTAYTDIDINDNPNFTKENGMLYNSQKTTAIKCFNKSSFGSDLSKLANTTTAIGPGCFRSLDDVFTTVTIPNTVTTIGDYAFDLSGITELIIPTSVTNIGAGLRANTITIASGNSVYTKSNHLVTKENGSYLVASDKSETEYSIPSSVNTIGAGAFFNSNMETIVIPTTVTTIGNYAFANSKLTTVTVSENVTSLGEHIFDSCGNLSNASMLATCSSLPDSTFSLCKSMEYIVLSSSISTIYSSFYNCTSLSKIYYLGSTTNAFSTFNGNNEAFTSATKYAYGTATGQWQY